MSVVIDNILLNKSTDLTYNLVLSSNDRIAGTHNNATFNIEWANFLPVDTNEYKVCFTFQSTGGYYSDGIFQKNPLAPTNGVVTIATSTASTSANNFLQFATNTGLTIGNYIYGVGIPTGTYITSASGTTPYTAFLSIPIIANLASGTVLQSVTPSYVNSVSFSSARILANFGGKSYSYDTSVKGQSLNLGVISRDTQTLTSKSNTYSAFYCQNPPRVISRPINNQFTISILNNSVFQGGVFAFNPDNSVASYGTVATGYNFLCDTLNISQGSVVGGTLLTDMTPWTMIIEFIPCHKKHAN